MAEEAKQTPPAEKPASKLKQRTMLIGLIVAGLLLIAAFVVGGVMLVKNSNPQSCAETQTEGLSLFKDKKYQQAYDTLKKEAGDCGGTDSDYTSVLKDHMKYNLLLSVSAYRANHKDDAKKYAKQGLDISKSVYGAQLTEGTDQFKMTFDLVDLSQGKYNALYIFQ
jgi:hypothetical protein